MVIKASIRYNSLKSHKGMKNTGECLVVRIYFGGDRDGKGVEVGLQL